MRNKKLIIVLIVVCSITLLLVLNSVIFSVQNVNAYCYNAEDDELSQTVIDNSGIKKGGSIFTLNKKEVTDALAKAVPEAKVVNVEKKFPNTVFINYVKVYEYLRIEKDGMYYFCGNDGTIMRISENPGLSDEIIELRLAATITNTAKGEKFSGESSSDVVLTGEILSALESLGYRRELVGMINFIDISKNQYIFVGMASGVVLELQGSANISAKLNMALSIYRYDTTTKTSGTIIIPDGDGSDGSHSDEDRYSQIMNKV